MFLLGVQIYFAELLDSAFGCEQGLRFALGLAFWVYLGSRV